MIAGRICRPAVGHNECDKAAHWDALARGAPRDRGGYRDFHCRALHALHGGNAISVQGAEVSEGSYGAFIESALPSIWNALARDARTEPSTGGPAGRGDYKVRHGLRLSTAM